MMKLRDEGWCKVSDIHGFEDRGFTILISVKYFASDILATGCAQYGGYHSDACTIGREADGQVGQNV